eukprot:492414_1
MSRTLRFQTCPRQNFVPLILALIVSFCIGYFFVQNVYVDSEDLKLMNSRNERFNTTKQTTPNPTTMLPTKSPSNQSSQPPTFNPTTQIPSASPANKAYNISTLSEFLKQYNISTLMKYIRQIESSIYFQKIADNNSDINDLYWTGKSPHFYDGPFNLNPGKTCKVLQYNYHCAPHSIIENAQFDEWTLRINETKLDIETKLFLNILQRQYNFYTNVYQKFIQNLKRYNSPYMRPINAFYFGNSHIKQIVQGLFCLMDDVEINLFHKGYNKAVSSFYPKIVKLNNSLPHQYSYNDTVCAEDPKMSKWRDFDRNGFVANLSEKGRIDKLLNKQFIAANVEQCRAGWLYSKLTDGTNIYLHNNHMNKNKRLRKFIEVTLNNIETQQDMKLKKNEIRNIMMDQDIIIFNIGNRPVYDFYNDLMKDLEYINHLNKPVLFLGQWYDWFLQEQPLDYGNSTFLRNLERKYPNLIFINLYGRNHEKLFQWNETLTPFHYGKYRWIIAEGEPDGHLCQPGVPEHHTLAMTELINLLLHIY